jgi:hypothetical protein
MAAQTELRRKLTEIPLVQLAERLSELSRIVPFFELTSLCKVFHTDEAYGKKSEFNTQFLVTRS